MIGVKGWFWANQLRPSGIVSVGTKALLRKGRRTRKIGRLLAVSTSRGHMPRATENHEMARAASARTPAAATHSIGPVVGRKPITSATIITIAIARRVWITLPITWPVRTDVRPMAIVLNRSTIPSVMSIAIESAVPWAAPATVTSRMPGST